MLNPSRGSVDPWIVHTDREGAIPEAAQILLPTFVALCLGALVGLERQVAEGESQGQKDFPGVRTFSFTALLGALAVLVSKQLGPWMGVSLFAATVAFLVLRYRYDALTRNDPGYTTEIASLCTFAVGVLAQGEQLLLATVLTIAMVALLRSKRALHRAGDLLSPADMEALIRFLVITGIVLPLLPDEPMAALSAIWRPFEVVRPQDVWRMVVLISGLSFIGYVLMRLRVGRAGYLITGLLGGLVSSTAATFAYGRAARSNQEPLRYESLIVLAASTSFFRMLVMIVVVAPGLLPRVGLPLSFMLATGITLALARHRSRDADPEAPTLENPLTLRLALSFAAIYAVILVLVSAVRPYLDGAGFFLLAAASSAAGADAPTLSLARLAADQQLDEQTAATAVVAVALGATLAKIALLAFVSPLRFVWRVGASLLLVAAVGVATLYAII